MPLEAVLLVSDTHVGRWTPTFNLVTAGQKFRYLTNQTIALLKRFPEITTVNVCLLGDIVEGEQVYPEQAHYLDVVDRDLLRACFPYLEAWRSSVSAHALLQTFIAAQFITNEIVCSLVNNGLAVKLNGVVGNHGRVKKAHPEVNYDAWCYLLINQMVKNIPNVTSVNLQPAQFLTTSVCGKTLLLYHGTGIPIYQQIPFYGIMRRSANWVVSKAFEEIHAVCVGHFHFSGYIAAPIPVFLNGTFVSDDLYPVEKLGLTGVQRQWLFGVSEEAIPAFLHEIRVDEVTAVGTRSDGHAGG